MTGRDQQDPPTPPAASVSDLINHYRAQQDAWREWQSQLERLHNQILAAAERQAATIVTTARADIMRILVEARRELLVLTSQVRAVTEGQEGPEVRREAGDGGAVPGAAASDVPDRLVRARHDLRRLLDEARPTLERLSEEAQAPGQRPQPKPEEEQRLPSAPDTSFSDTSPSGDEARRLASLQDTPYVPASQGDGDENRKWLSRKVMVAIVSLVATSTLLGLVWWRRPEPVSVERVAPQTAAAQAAEVPSQAAPAVAETPPPSATASPQFLSLLVEAHREAWIESTIDGKADAGRLYPAGETRRIEGARNVLLRVGDAGAVTVSVNGKEAEILGQDGRIVIRQYTVDDAPVPPADPRGHS